MQVHKVYDLNGLVEPRLGHNSIRLLTVSMAWWLLLTLAMVSLVLFPFPLCASHDSVVIMECRYAYYDGRCVR